MNEIKHPISFKTGYRILMLNQRGKDGGKVGHCDRSAKKMISKNEVEFEICYQKLLALKKPEERIYSTIDERDIDKGIMLFKHRQLDADYYGLDDRNSFYTDIWNRWISALASPNSKKGTLFLIDIDDVAGGQNVGQEKEIKKQLKEKEIEIMHEYPTKNGKHIITKPFNPTTVTFYVQKNAMLLLAY